MRYTEHTLPAALSSSVRCVWSLQGKCGDAAAAPQPVLPDGCAELILNLGEPFEEMEADGWRKQPVRFLYGQITKAIQLRPAGDASMVGVRFQPWGVYQLFGATAVRDGKTRVELIDGPWDHHLSSVLHEGSIEKAVTLVIDALLTCAQHPVEAALLRFTAALQDPDTSMLDPLKARMPMSERQLERRFLAVVGLRPKLFARIIRLRRLIDLLHAGDVKGFAALANAAGYFDQAHFNRDLKAFTGMAPRAYFQQDLVLPAYFSGVR